MDPERTIKGIISSLESTKGIAEEAHMTGAFKGGINRARMMYNGALQYLESTEIIDDLFFPALDDDAPFDDIGVACGQLAAYLRGYLGVDKRNPSGPLNIDINEMVAGILGRNAPSKPESAPDPTGSETQTEEDPTSNVT